jgi:uncharacterized protein (TIGR02246 family)
VKTTSRPSAKKWVAFSLCAGFLVLLAFLGVRQFHKTRVKKDTTTSAPRSQTKSREQETGPETTVNEFVQAWNRGDTENIVGLFAPDGVLIIPSGSEVRSRAEIKKIISQKRNSILKDTTLRNTVDDVSNQDLDTAFVKGTYQLEGIKLLGFSTTSTGSYVFQQTKQGDRWLIAKAEILRE